MSVFFLTVLLIIGSSLPIQAGPSGKNTGYLERSNPKYQKTYKIIRNIAKTYDGRKLTPRFKMIAKGGPLKWVIAEIRTKKGDRPTIYVDERLYDLCQTFGKDADNCLSVVLSHELAHHYNNHNWGGSFASAHRGTDIGSEMGAIDRSMEDIRKLETQADDDGWLHGFLAGYDPLSISTRVLKAIYKEYGLKDENLKNYPKRDERIHIAEVTRDKLLQLIPLFETANHMVLLKQYQEAYRIYDYIALKYPGPEIFNNAGVARAKLALTLFDPKDVNAVYPFEIDPETRLRDLYRGGHKGFALGKEEIPQLLEDAEQNFRAAIKSDRNYASAYVNLAAVLELQKRPDEALEATNTGIRLAKKNDSKITLANAYMVRGIIYKGQGKIQLAQADFEISRKEKPQVALLNSKLMTANADKVIKVKENKEAPLFNFERICGVASNKMNTREQDLLARPIQMVKIPEADDLNPGVTVYSKNHPGCQVTMVDNNENKIIILSTRKDFKEKSTNGEIALNDSLNKVVEQYGKPSRKFSARGFNYLVFEGGRIAFKMDEKNRVAGWLIYQISK